MSSAHVVRSSGFSLIELIIMIVVTGILSAVLLINISAQGQHSVNVQADMFRRDLSHLQLLAISKGLRLRLSVNATGNNYTVYSCAISDCNTVNVMIDPATGSDFSIDLTDGVTLAPVSATLDFDSLGRPVSGTSLILVDPAKNFTLSGSGRDVSVAVQPITGFAHNTTY